MRFMPVHAALNFEQNQAHGAQTRRLADAEDSMGATGRSVLRSKNTTVNASYPAIIPRYVLVACGICKPYLAKYDYLVAYFDIFYIISSYFIPWLSWSEPHRQERSCPYELDVPFGRPSGEFFCNDPRREREETQRNHEHSPAYNAQTQMLVHKVAENTVSSLHGGQTIRMHVASQWLQAYKTNHDEEKRTKGSKHFPV